MARVSVASAVMVLWLAAPVFGQQASGLELLILANSVDDARAIRDAIDYVEAAGNKAALAKCQQAGMPPPALTVPDGKAPTKYFIHVGVDSSIAAAREQAKKDIDRAAKKLREANSEKLEEEALSLLQEATQRLKKIPHPNNAKSVVTYCWVRIGPQELKNLNLDNGAENDPKRNAAWKKAKEMRGLATSLPADSTGMRQLYSGCLFYSRECKDATLTQEERNKIKVEYFVLARKTEIDPNDSKQEKEIDRIGNKHITKTQDATNELAPSLKDDGYRAIWLHFNAAGEKLLADLTGKNVPTKARNGDGNVLDAVPIKRHIAIAVDGVLITAPTINAPINGDRLMISTRFTEMELRQLLEKLQPKK